MSTNNEERRKLPSQETIDNTVAISKLTVIAESTTKDVDRLVKHIDKFLPVHEMIANIKKIIYSSLFVAIGFGTWITLEYFTLHSEVSTHIAVQNELNREIEEKLGNNENQISYVKGRVK